MNCKKIQRKLLEYLKGELSGNLLESFESHLKNCPICQKELAELKKTLTLLDQLPIVELKPEQEAKFLTEIHQKIQRQARLRPVPFQWRWLLPRLIPALVAASILIFFVLMKFKASDEKYTELAANIFTVPSQSLSGEFVHDYFKINGNEIKELSQFDSNLIDKVESYLNDRLEMPDLVEGLTKDEKNEFVKKISEML